MTSLPPILSLIDADLSKRIEAALGDRVEAYELARDGEDLLERVEDRTRVLLDPAFAPTELGQRDFVSSIAARTDRVVARVTPELDEETLVGLGAADVFHDSTSPRLVIRRVGDVGPEASSEPDAGEAEEEVDVEPDVALPAGADVLTPFIERVSVRLSRARDRERSVAIFCVALHGVTTADPKQTIQQVLESVLEELESSQEMSYSASRTAMASLGACVYAVLVPDVERVQDAARLGVRLHETLALRAGLTAHVGIACSPDDGSVAVELVERAREAALRARQTGENNVEFFSESMSRWAFERLTLEQSLRDALRNEELAVYYQPRVDIETRKILGMEALIRWIHPQFGLVSPGQFIPLAEETGLIVPIGDWVLREACRQNAEWRAMGLPRIRVSVNLSPVQFRKPDLHTSVGAALDDMKLDADGLELEVTESLLMNDPAETAAALGRMRSRGIHISIDDFGTGYSSLSYLTRFPIDSLKIDRSFVTDVTSNPDDAAIATAIILMGHSLKLTVVAEGVETENQLAFLKVLQCNEVQGYLFSPPVPADRAQAMLEEQQAGTRSAA
ncbi:MAG: EAL domain-containing protein [Planctomycetota bacterium]